MSLTGGMTTTPANSRVGAVPAPTAGSVSTWPPPLQHVGRWIVRRAADGGDVLITLMPFREGAVMNSVRALAERLGSPP